jgi:lipid-A-disaccharide synthase-like uncharacterized protein
MINVGLVGVFFIVLAWIIGTIDFVKKEKKKIDLNFAFVYIFGVALLALYAHQINDPIFFWLKIILFIMVAFEIMYTIYSMSKGWKWK